MRIHARNLREGMHAWLGDRWQLVLDAHDEGDVTVVSCTSSTFRLNREARVEVLTPRAR